MIILLSLLNLAAITMIAFAFYRKVSVGKKFYWPALIAKLSAGVALGLLYKYYYPGGDTWLFFEQAVRLTEIGKEDLGRYVSVVMQGADAYPMLTAEPRSFFFIVVLSVLNFFTDNNYWLLSLWLSLFSFIGSFYLFVKMIQTLPEEKPAAAIAILFFPSVLFWSAGLLKESLAFGALCFLAGIVVHLGSQQRLKMADGLIMLIALPLLLLLKYYWAAVFLPVGITYVFIQWIDARWNVKPLMKLVYSFATFIFLVMVASWVHPNFYPERFLGVIVDNNIALRAISGNGMTIQYHDLQANWFSVILNSPWALLSGLFRPMIGEGSDLLQWTAGFENFFLLLLFGGCIFRFSSLRISTLGWAVIVYIIILCVFLALSTPNLGTLSRYRIGFLPFFVFILLMGNRFSHWDVTKRLFPD